MSRVKREVPFAQAMSILYALWLRSDPEEYTVTTSIRDKRGHQQGGLTGIVEDWSQKPLKEMSTASYPRGLSDTWCRVCGGERSWVLAMRGPNCKKSDCCSLGFKD